MSLCICIIFFVDSLVNGHLDCFHILANEHPHQRLTSSLEVFFAPPICLLVLSVVLVYSKQKIILVRLHGRKSES